MFYIWNRQRAQECQLINQ